MGETSLIDPSIFEVILPYFLGPKGTLLGPKPLYYLTFKPFHLFSVENRWKTDLFPTKVGKWPPKTVKSSVFGVGYLTLPPHPSIHISTTIKRRLRRDLCPKSTIISRTVKGGHGTGGYPPGGGPDPPFRGVTGPTLRQSWTYLPT